MKKNYFMLAAAAAMFAACAETDFVNEAVVAESNAPQAIGFETFSNKSTRHSTSTAMNTYHTEFGVFGYNDVDGLFMENYKVAYAASKWGYNGLQGGVYGVTDQETKYWNKNTSYDFFAYAPYKAGTPGDPGVPFVTINSGKFTIPSGDYAAEENLQQIFKTAINEEVFESDTDWMLATPKQDYTYASGATVPLVFSHMLSKLVVAVQTSGDEDVVITNLEVTGDTYKTGSYNGEKWTATNEVVLEGAVGTVAAKNTKYYSMEYLLIPVDEAEPKLSITYKVNGQTYTQSNLAIANLTEFAAGTYYTLTVSVGLEPIEFSATAAVWTVDGTGGSVSIQ